MPDPSAQPQAPATPAEPARLTLPQRPRAKRPGRAEQIRRTLGAWAENTFSREQVVGALKTLLWVAPLTLLIWVYAEREQSVPSLNPVTVRIAITSDDPTRIVTLKSPSQPYVMVKLYGPRAQLDGLRERMESRDAPPIQIQVPRGGATGEQRVNAAAVGQDQRFVDAGVTVTSVQPEVLEVVVDELAKVQVPVQAMGKLPLLKDPKFNPPTVEVEGPKSVLESASVDNRLFAVAVLEGRPEINAATERGDASVELRDIAVSSGLKDDRVKLVGPKTVSAVLDLKERREWTIPFMTVFVVSPPDLLRRKDVTYDATLLNVTVVGPADVIERVQQASYLPRPKATFEVTDDDEGIDKWAPLKFELPEGVKLKPGQTDKEQIKFSLVKRP